MTLTCKPILRALDLLLALALAAWARPAAAPAAPAASAASAVAAPAQRLADLCTGCAIVTEIRAETRQGKGGAVGVIGGAVVGGLLGNQVGGGTGRTLATLGGAAAGGYAGNEVQKRATKTTVWITRATLKDGTVRSFENSNAPGFKVGEVVNVVGDE